MADFDLALAGTVSVDGTARNINFTWPANNSERRPEITNPAGGASVFVKIGAEPATAVAAESLDQIEIKAGETVRMPRRCNFVSVITAGSTILLRVNDN